MLAAKYSIALVDTPQCPCPWTHGVACREFLDGWRDHGFQVGEALSLQECAPYDWLLLSNHNVDWRFLDALAAQNPNTIFILWSYHNHVDRIPFKKWILTGEQYVEPPTLPGHIATHAIALQLPQQNYHPLWLRANEAPHQIGLYTRPHPPQYLGYFAGSGYKRDWLTGLPQVFYHDVHTAGLLSATQRRDVALQSIFAFGFHSNENVANNHVTQRVFEGLAYGCVVLSDNPAAAKLTGGIVEYVENATALQERIKHFLAEPQRITEKQQAGYAWAKQFGTNRAAAEQFLHKAAELYAADP